MYKRKLVEQLINRMHEKRRFMQIVIGPRQTGKTTAVLQALESLSKPYHYISADDPILVSPEWLRNEWEKARALQKQEDRRNGHRHEPPGIPDQLDGTVQ